ncbi:MAG: ribosomal RNA small subunit methyltransferase A [Candidatus Sungbacteria bacterium]|nr:ribosomal RNA small subunit methyltransferase A [Candidatus Sungbacteria bacterium]
MTISEVKNALAKYGIRPNKLLGQNFLVDENILKKIVDVANIKPDETILEIGPGLGELTFELAQRAKKVIAVEKDRTLFEILKNEIAKRGINPHTKDFGVGVKNIELICGDVLRIDMGIFARISPYHVVANIPYYLTARVIRKLLEEVEQPQSIMLTVQKEVAERITAKPPEMNLLALAVQVYGEPKIIFPISKSAFWPEPEVDSAVIAIENISRQKFIKAEVGEKLFFKIIRAAFQGKRKVLANSLSHNLKINKEKVDSLIKQAGLGFGDRPETISVDKWLRLTDVLAKKLPEE